MKEHMKSELDKAVNIDSLNKNASRNECTIENEGNEKENTERTSETEVEEDNGMFTYKLCKDKLNGNGASKYQYIKKHKKVIKGNRNSAELRYK